ncbi:MULTISPECIES: alpha/beta fold hydrolase [unclassified Flavobacterium]|uniref:alpha/beta fold hydrolase n=1 Tax=unclassified Flavobacterium TaxID=196869 RepID=UPI001F14554F|nr:MULTISPECIES: alpha/beta hydrolase [unclassified Flavobacterium]UMY64575.1 alpha/beta hydrolase [Flavobacterium sp. HJ-32-4]
MDCFRYLLSVFLVLGAWQSGTAQTAVKRQDWASVCQTLDATPYAGYEFRMRAAIRMENGRKGSVGSLWARVDKSDGTNGFFKNAADVIRATGDWKVQEITGTLDATASLLNVGAYCQNGADYYYDNFTLEVRKGKEKWKTVPLQNAGFEQGNPETDGWKSGIGTTALFTVQDFAYDFSTTQPFAGSRCLHIYSHTLLGSANGKFVEANGAQLYYEVYGEGEPLLMLHGNGQAMSSFVNQLEPFAKKFKVILVDCRARGNSSYPPGVPLNFDLLADDIAAFMDKIQVPKAHILGWSDGGIIGIVMALRHPEKVDRLVAMGANIFPEGVFGLDLMKEQVAIWEKENTDHHLDLAIDLLKLDMLYPQLTFEQLGAITSKTLIMAGDHDEIQPEHTLKMYQAIPDAELAILPDSSHFVPQQNPELFNATVMRFLTKSR